MARWEERAARPEDKSFRDSLRLDVAGGTGMAQRPAWAEVNFSTCQIREVTESPWSLTTAIGWARRGAMAS